MFSLIKNERGNWTLIGLLVAVAAGLALMFFVLLPKIGPDRLTDQATKDGLVQPKEGQTVVGASLDAAKSTACASNLDQIRKMLVYQKTAGEPLPATLQEMKLGSASMCPVSMKLYQYDPNTGAVRCTTPGHEGL